MSSVFVPYPDLENKNFYKKIYQKKEFYETKPDPLPDPDNQSNKTMELIYPKRGDFKLQSGQMFLKNFISEATPYRGILIIHGTGTGKSCASIVIAERFHGRVNETGRKILIIAEKSIQEEFSKTIFNFEKETKKNPRQVVQCTGRTYQLGKDVKYLTLRKQEVQISKMIKDIYEIVGRDKLRNKLLKETGWDGDKKNLNDNIRNKIKEIYSNRVIIIDEVHNRANTSDSKSAIYDKKINISFPTVLEVIIGIAENIRLVLMSATPMFNFPSEIIEHINLLRLNDRRPTVKKSSVFDNNNNFVKGGEKLLREICKGYISYIRGGDPPRFPYKIIAPESKVPNPKYLFNGEKILESLKLKYTKVIKCYMEKFQYTTYKADLKYELKEGIGGILPGPSQSSNIIFPTSDSEKYGVYGSGGYGPDSALVVTKNSRGNQIYSYSSFSRGFLLRKNIKKYSTKFASMYDNLVSSTGISFVYSHWVPAGVLALALMLEENGFEPAIITGKEYVRLNSNTKKPKICYLCGKTKHGPEDHTWSPAKYVLFTGELDKNDSSKISAYINREENMYGKLVKVLLGSDVAGEGIDFKRIRQVHIMEPWYNMSKIDQVEGRAIRNGSHKDLPPEQRNVEIFKYCIVPPKSLKGKNQYIETIDEHDYRISEDKDKKIKKVDYILKEVAIDCMFQRDNNIRNVHRTVKLEDSRGNIINYVTGDKPYSRDCNYMKSCTYKCEWEPKNVKDVLINKSTYGIEFAEIDIDKVRNKIYKLYKKNNVIDKETMFNEIKEEHSDIEDIYIYIALESLMNKKGDYSVQDRYGREGYIVERGDLYIFQPFELDNIEAPFLYKKTPLKTKPTSVPFSGTNIEKNINFNKESENISGENILKERLNYYNNIRTILKQYVKKENKFTDIFVDIVFYSLSDVNTLELLKYIVSPIYEKSGNKLNKELEDFKNIAVNYYKNNRNILKSNKTLAIMVGKLCSQWGRSKFGGKKKKKQGWGKCDSDIEARMTNELNNYNYIKLWEKVSENKRIREDEKVARSEYLFILKQAGIRPEYMGTVESKVEGNEKYFKLFNFKKYINSNTVSKRKELRGRECSNLHVPVLKKILGELEMIVSKVKITNIKIPDISGKKILRPKMCLRIEFLMRLLNDNTKDVWFYKGFFLQDDLE